MKKIILFILISITLNSYSQFHGCKCERENKTIVEENGYKYYREDALPKNIEYRDKIVVKKDTIIQVKKITKEVIKEVEKSTETKFEIGNSIPKTLQYKCKGNFDPIFSSIDKQTKLITGNDGKTIIPYIEKTYYNQDNKPIYIEKLDPQTLFTLNQ